MLLSVLIAFPWMSVFIEEGITSGENHRPSVGKLSSLSIKIEV